VAGPNLLSIPLQVWNSSLAAVLQTVNFTTARRYDPLDPDPWKEFAAGKASNDLATVPFGSAMWVSAVAAGEYVVLGKVPAAVVLPLKAGWNLVAYASSTPRSVAMALAGIPYTRVEVFEPAAVPFRLRTATGAETLAPGQALWIRVSADATWAPPP